MQPRAVGARDSSDALPAAGTSCAMDRRAAAVPDLGLVFITLRKFNPVSLFVGVRVTTAAKEAAEPGG